MVRSHGACVQGGRAGGKGADPDQPWTAVTDFINADFTTAFAEQDNLPDVVHLNMRIAMELCDLGASPLVL